MLALSQFGSSKCRRSRSQESPDPGTRVPQRSAGLKLGLGAWSQSRYRSPRALPSDARRGFLEDAQHVVHREVFGESPEMAAYLLEKG